MCLFLISLSLSFAIWLGDSGIERAVLIFSVGMVLVVEILNSSVEAVVDRISHEFSGYVKDLGSTAIMLTLIFGVHVECIFKI